MGITRLWNSMISDTCIHLLGVCGKAGLYYVNFWLYSYGYCASPQFCQHMPVRFRAHTPNCQAMTDGWWFSPVVCAGSVLGMEIPGQVFLLTCLPWACQVIPWWIYCLFKQVWGCVWRSAMVLLSLLSYGSHSILRMCKTTFFRASFTFWRESKTKQKTLLNIKRLNVLWRNQKI